MPDNNGTTGEISNNSIVETIQIQGMSDSDIIRGIYATLKDVSRPDGLLLSQSTLRDMVDSGSSNSGRGRLGDQSGRSSSSREGRDRRANDSRSRVNTGRGKTADDFANGLVDEFKKSLFGSSSPFKDALRGPLNDLAKRLDVDVSELSGELGKRLGNIGAEAFKKTKAGKAVDQVSDLFNKKMSDAGGQFIDGLGDILTKGTNIDPSDIIKLGKNALGDNFGNIFGEMGKILNGVFDSSIVTEGGAVAAGGSEVVAAVEGIEGAAAATEAMGTAATLSSTALATTSGASTAASSGLLAAGTAGGAAAGGLAGLAAAALPFLPIILAVGAGLALLANIFGPVIESVGDFIGAMRKAANRADTQSAKFLQLQQQRIKDDILQLVKSSFDVIEESAKKAMQVWDDTLKVVTSSQEYTKADMQTLWAGYAEKLRESNLDAVISSADIMSNLKTVLEKGLSGQVAEEFAYIATILNEAVPTQDFFQYASTYAAVAAQAIAKGQSQQEAIEYANTQLKEFAGNLLHASRNIAGGFTTTLQDGAHLFEESAKIAATSSKMSVGSISGVLTAISASVGSVAPDLASGLVDAIISASTGGNSSELTALRSLAGVGASNTAFLKALTEHPEEVISNLFSKLGELQTMSAANYMEVAEALSDVFGISRETFARVDFSKVAAAVSSIATNTVTGSELSQSIQLLANGQTTASSEQARMQKINEYMVNEGLAYVLDNEVARAVQEHMWQEQLAREIEENKYAVDLSGKSLGIIAGIAKSVTNLLTTVVPGLGAVKDALTVAATLQESAAQQADLLNVLQNGVVGEGNSAGGALELYQLTTTGTDLYLAGTYNQRFNQVHGITKLFDPLNGTAEALNSMPGLLSLGLNGLSATKLNKTARELGDVFLAARDTNKITESDIMSKLKEIATGSATGVAGAAKGIMDKVGSVIGSTLNDTRKLFKNLQTRIGKQYADSLSKEYKEAYSTRDWLSDTSNASGTISGTKAYSALWKNASASRTDTYDVENILGYKSKYGTGLAGMLTASIDEYVTKTTELSRAADGIRKDLETNNDILIQRDKDIFEREGKSADEYSLLHRDFLTQEQMLSEYMKVRDESIKVASERTFENWVAEFERSKGFTTNPELGSNLEALLSEYGTTIEEVRAVFENRELAAASASTKARELHEVQFWEDMQQFATKDFPWYMREWERYYIQHEAYTDATAEAYKHAVDLQVEEKGELGDSVLALAEALIENNNWQESLGDKLKDPVVHTNVLLSKILLTTEAIMQQNNETSIVSVPTALSSLGLGVSNY